LAGPIVLFWHLNISTISYVLHFVLWFTAVWTLCRYGSSLRERERERLARLVLVSTCLLFIYKTHCVVVSVLSLISVVVYNY